MTAALNIGSRALTANLTALQVIGHNIANVNTAGYSRQSVSMVSSGYQTLGGNYFGKGAELGTVERSHSSYLTREAQLAAATSAADTERLQRLQQLETLFPTGETGLGAAVNDMLNAWGDVASSPSSLPARVVALSRGDELASRLADTAAQVDALAYNGRQQAQATVDKVNGLAQDIARINQRIIENQGSQGQPNDLLDQRDDLLDQLSQYVQTTTIPADDGSMSVFVAGSQPLVLGTTANGLALQRDPVDATQSRIMFRQGSISHALPDSSIGGSLGGLMTFLTQDLPGMQNELGRMALAINTMVNEQHRLGVDLAGNAGGDFFVPAGDEAALPAVTNTGDAVIHSEVADATALKASDYRLTYTASGVDITRLSDGTSSSFAGLPAEFDGLSFELDSGAGAVGDSFLLRPFANAARNMQMALAAPSQLAAASPVAVTPASGNSGGVAIEKLYAVDDSAYLSNPVTIDFLADGSYTVSGSLDPASPAPDNAGPPPSYNYTPGQPIEFNGWSITLRGRPAAGDSFDIAPATAGSTAQNSGNADALLALRDQATFDGVSLSDGYGSLLSHLGTAVQGAQFASEFSGQIATSTENARAAVSGVNLDEEAARLLQFQQSYQAAAKFLQVAQNAFDTMIGIMG
jgi:flagellar hook-associated protein 1 FlgK